MNFWDNLLRYPKFFLSSLLGLVLIIVSPIINLSKDIQNKSILFLVVFLIIITIVYILIQMLNLTETF